MKRLSKMQQRLALVKQNKLLIYGQNVPTQAQRKAIQDTPKRSRAVRIRSMLDVVPAYYKTMRRWMNPWHAAIAATKLAWEMVTP